MTTTIGSTDLNALSGLYSDSNQYFWFESNSSATYGAGVHVTLVPDTTFINNPTSQNILMNTDGFSIRNGLLPMMTLDNDSLDFNVVDTTTGTYVTTATFSSTGTQIGQSDGSQSYMYLDYHSMRMIDIDGNTYVNISDLRDSSGVAELGALFIADGATTTFKTPIPLDSVTSVKINGTVTTAYTVNTSTSEITFTSTPSAHDYIWVEYESTSQYAKAYTLGFRGQGLVGAMSLAEGNATVASGAYAHAEGMGSRAEGASSHAEGDSSNATADWAHAEGSAAVASSTAAHAEGNQTTASGFYSHAEGEFTTASGDCSHAEGDYTTASFYTAHAEGDHTTASGTAAHAEGYYTIASGVYAHAEGDRTEASGIYAHAQNQGTKASGNAMTAIGKYNTNNYFDNILEIGNGTSDSSRSNALTVDWFGTTTIYSSDIDITSTTTPTTSKYSPRYVIHDKNDKRLASIHTVHNTSNNMGLCNVAYRRISGTDYSNTFMIYLNSSGDPHYWCTDKANFRSDMGCQATLSTTSWTPTITRTSGGTLSSLAGRKYGNVVTLKFVVTYSTSVSAGGNVFVGNLTNSGYIPPFATFASTYYSSVPIMCQLESSGKITCRVTGSSAVTISSGCTFGLTYIVA